MGFSAFLKQLQTKKQKCQPRTAPDGAEVRGSDTFAFLFNCFKSSFSFAFCIFESMAEIQTHKSVSRADRRGERAKRADPLPSRAEKPKALR